MKKKIILLQIRRHYGELDWIFPILYLLKKRRFKIITYFDDYNSYENLTKNQLLYNQWKNLSKDYYIQKKTDKLFLKIIFEIIKFLNNKFKNINFLFQYLKFIAIKVYNVSEILKKNNIKDFKLIFCSNNNFSNLCKYFKQSNQSIKIIRFPTSQHVRFFKKTLVKEKKILFGDKYLFRFKEEAIEYFGNKINDFFFKNQIIFCGNIKYEKWWLDKLFPNNFKKNKKFTIFVATRGFFTAEEIRLSKVKILSEKSFVFMIHSIMKLASVNQDIQFIFKTHPTNKEYYLLNNILSGYKNLNWRIDFNHASISIQKCDLAIVFSSSVCLDVLAMRKPCIEFYLNNADNHGLIKINNKLFTTYQLNKLVLHVETYQELSKTINKLKNRKKYYQKVLINQYQNFIRVNKLTKYSAEKAIKNIL